MVYNPLLTNRTARPSSRGGFTLVELLVVIGIIAILAGVALGPITAGIKKAQQSSGVQTTRTIALAEFTYSNDNNQTWPLASSGTATDASDLVKVLLGGNYINDTSIFYIGGSGEKKYTGSISSPTITKANISYDFTAISLSQPLNSNVPDQVPVVFSSYGSQLTFPTGPNTALAVTPVSTNPFGTAGFAACLKSNSAKFILATGSPATANLVDTSFPGASAVSVVGGG